MGESGEGGHLRSLQEAVGHRSLQVLAPWNTSTWPAGTVVFSWVMGHHDSFNLEILFTAREIARFGETTTSSNSISMHGDYSNEDL